MRDDPDSIARAGVVSLWARVAGVARHPNPEVSDPGVPALSFAVLDYVAQLPLSAVFPPVAGDPSQYDTAWSSSSASARSDRASARLRSIASSWVSSWLSRPCSTSTWGTSRHAG